MKCAPAITPYEIVVVRIILISSGFFGIHIQVARVAPKLVRQTAIASKVSLRKQLQNLMIGMTGNRAPITHSSRRRGVQVRARFAGINSLPNRTQLERAILKLAG